MGTARGCGRRPCRCRRSARSQGWVVRVTARTSVASEEGRDDGRERTLERHVDFIRVGCRHARDRIVVGPRWNRVGRVDTRAVGENYVARGERLGAGPVLRVWRAALLWASRFWQIESLYRANAKYQPEWVPRFVCFRSSADLPRVSVAGLRAEAFLVAPEWWQRLSRRLR